MAASEQEQVGGVCGHHSGICQTLEDHGRRLDGHDQILDRIFEKLDLITSRLMLRPGWGVTIIISTLTALLGFALTVIGFVVKGD